MVRSAVPEQVYEAVPSAHPSRPGIAVRRTASLPLAYARPSTSFRGQAV